MSSKTFSSTGFFGIGPKTNQLGHHLILLVPLLLTVLLQRAEHVIDNRFLASLGTEALSIHSIFFNFFLMGQAIGTATATSALIFWRRDEAKGGQGTLLKYHIYFAFLSSAVLALGIYPFLENIVLHFHVSTDFSNLGKIYLGLGLINLILQSVYGTLNAILIASEQRARSLILIAGLLLLKIITGSIALNLFWDGNALVESVTAPLLIIGGSSVFFLSVLVVFAYRSIVKKADGWKVFDVRKILSIWKSEFFFAIVRSIAPIGFSFQLAQIVNAGRFFVTYQLALQTAYIMVLPLLAGNQIAIRDASEEQSHRDDQKIIPLKETGWFGNFLFSSLLPSELFLLIGALIPALLMSLLFGYAVPEGHTKFLNLYFFACAIGQVGNVMALRLRSTKRNSVVFRNSVICELIVQLGLMQFVLINGVATADDAGVVTLIYCFSNFLLNSIAVWKTSRMPLPEISAMSMKKIAIKVDK